MSSSRLMPLATSSGGRMQRVFSSAARRTISRARRESDRRGGELKIDWTQTATAHYELWVFNARPLRRIEERGKEKPQIDASCLFWQHVEGWLGERIS